MISRNSFPKTEKKHASSFAEALLTIKEIRLADSSPILIEIDEGVEQGNFVFPYSNVMIVGLGAGRKLVGHLYAKMLDEQEKELTTWKTPTLKVTGSHNFFENMSIVNDSGEPALKGQEVALAVYGDDNAFCLCKLLSSQDTLFSGPLPDDLTTRYAGFLPDEERYHEGNCRNYYFDCSITGSVDFIFGAGQAIFDKCRLISIDDGRKEGYVAAPAHSLKDPIGFLFNECDFSSPNLPNNSIYLARPWRDYGKAVFLNCSYGPHIKSEGFSDWVGAPRTTTARFEEYPLEEGRVSWTHNEKGSIETYEALVDEVRTNID